MINAMTDFVIIVNFPVSDGDLPRRPSYGVYISQLTRFDTVCSRVDDFNACNKCLTSKLLNQGYRYHKLRKLFQISVAVTVNWFQNSM